MSILSDNEILKYIEEGIISIDPYDLENVQGATVDFRLGEYFLVPDYFGELKEGDVTISLEGDLRYRKIKDDKMIILSRHFILGTTLETLTLPKYLSARVDGKSGIGRRGLSIQNAGHIGPGFSGEITLELENKTDFPIRLKKGILICQIEFHELSSPAERVYKGRFQGQRGPKV